MSVPIVPVRSWKVAIVIERDLGRTTVPSPIRGGTILATPPQRAASTNRLAYVESRRARQLGLLLKARRRVASGRVTRAPGGSLVEVPPPRPD